jgi:hypothetical protein
MLRLLLKMICSSTMCAVFGACGGVFGTGCGILDEGVFVFGRWWGVLLGEGMFFVTGCVCFSA